MIPDEMASVRTSDGGPDGTEPVLEVWMDGSGPGEPASLRCVGQLNAETRMQLLLALAQILDSEPSIVTVDVSELHVDDHGADTLNNLPATVEDAGSLLVWRGLRGRHVLGIG